MKNILKKITNTKIIIAIVSGVVLILTTWGVEIPVEKIDTTVKVICSLGVALGIFTKDGMETAEWNK